MNRQNKRLIEIILPVQVWYVRPNRDTAAMKLENVLVFASQFLDGSLEPLFVLFKPGHSSSSSPSNSKWRVDVDLRPGVFFLDPKLGFTLTK